MGNSLLGLSVTVSPPWLRRLLRTTLIPRHQPTFPLLSSTTFLTSLFTTYPSPTTVHFLIDIILMFGTLVIAFAVLVVVIQLLGATLIVVPDTLSPVAIAAQCGLVLAIAFYLRPPFISHRLRLNLRARVHI